MNTISGRQVTCFLLVVLSGWSLTMTAQNGHGGWIPLVSACLCSLILVAICCIPSERLPNTKWFDFPQTAFGTIGGTLYLLVLTALAFWSLYLCVLGGVIFLRTVSGGQWPVWLLIGAILLCAACAAQGGIQRLVLWTEPVIWVVVIALAISLILSFQQLDFSQLLPVFTDSVAKIPLQTYFLLSVPFGEVFYAAAVLAGTGSQTRTGLLRACILAGILLCLLYIRNICLLGEAGSQAVLYPSYTAASVLAFGESFQRGEALISGSLIVCAVARAALLLTFLSGSIQTVTRYCSTKQATWSIAVLAGIVCIITVGNNTAFAQAQQLYQLVFFPIVLLCAILLAIGIILHQKKCKS